MKRWVFWITFAPACILMYAAGLLALLPCAFIGVVKVFHELLTRYEWFMLEHKKIGYKFHRTSLKDIFLEAFHQ